MQKRILGPRRSGGDPDVRRQSAAYQGGVEAVVALLLCLGIGYYADLRWQSSPTGLLIGVVIGFSAFVLRLVRLRDLWKTGTDESEPPAKE